MGLRSKLKAAFKKRFKHTPLSMPPSPPLPSIPSTPPSEYLYVRVYGRVLEHERQENTILITGWALEIAPMPTLIVPNPSGTVVSITKQDEPIGGPSAVPAPFELRRSQVTAGFKTAVLQDYDIKARFQIAEISERAKVDDLLNDPQIRPVLSDHYDAEGLQLTWLTVVIAGLANSSMYPSLSPIMTPNSLGDISTRASLRSEVQRVLDALLRKEHADPESIPFPRAPGDLIPTLKW